MIDTKNICDISFSIINQLYELAKSRVVDGMVYPCIDPDTGRYNAITIERDGVYFWFNGTDNSTRIVKVKLNN